jgi:thiamine-phosphate pyrophosphorylase
MTKRCDLYLRLDASALSASALPEVEALLRDARPAALLLLRANRDVPLNRLRRAAKCNGRQTVAILIENDARLAVALNADGVHLRGHSMPIAEARRLLGEAHAIGVSCPLTRHEAMVMAEAGADYIAFGDAAAMEPRDIGALSDMIGWWDELFEVPCAAWLSDADTESDAEGLMRAGADFLCIHVGTGDFERRSAMIRDIAAMTSGFARTA